MDEPFADTLATVAAGRAGARACARRQLTLIVLVGAWASRPRKTTAPRVLGRTDTVYPLAELAGDRVTDEGLSDFAAIYSPIQPQFESAPSPVKQSCCPVLMHAPPDRGGTHRFADGSTEQYSAPMTVMVQQATAFGRPQVEWTPSPVLNSRMQPSGKPPSVPSWRTAWR